MTEEKESNNIVTSDKIEIIDLNISHDIIEMSSDIKQSCLRSPTVENSFLEQPSVVSAVDIDIKKLNMIREKIKNISTRLEKVGKKKQLNIARETIDYMLRLNTPYDDFYFEWKTY